MTDSDEVAVTLLLEAAEDIKRRRDGAVLMPSSKYAPRPRLPTPPQMPPPQKVISNFRRSHVADTMLESMGMAPALNPDLNSFKGVEDFVDDDEGDEEEYGDTGYHDGGKGYYDGGKGYYDGGKGYSDGGKGYDSGTGYYDGDKGHDDGTKGYYDGGKSYDSGKGYGGGRGYDGGSSGGSNYYDSGKGHGDKGYYSGKYSAKGYAEKDGYDPYRGSSSKGYDRGHDRGYDNTWYDRGDSSSGGYDRGYDRGYSNTWYDRGGSSSKGYDSGHGSADNYSSGYYPRESDDDKGHYDDGGKGYDKGYYDGGSTGYGGGKGSDKGYDPYGSSSKGHDKGYDGGKGGHGYDEQHKPRGGRHIRLAKALAAKEMNEGLDDLMQDKTDRDYISWSKKVHWRVWSQVQVQRR